MELKKLTAGIDNESEQNMIDKIKGLKIEIVDASKKDGNIYEQNKDNNPNS